MRRLLVAVLALFFLLSLQVPGASALRTPNVTFIPPVLSINSSFLAVADPGTGASIRVGWTIPGFENAYGLFPLVDGKYTCYFSDSDQSSNCGPVPFKYSTIGMAPYTMFVEAIDSYGAKTNLTRQVDIGSMSLSPTVQVTGSTVYMVVSSRGGIPSSLLYSVYKTDLTPVQTNSQLTYNIVTDRFTGNTDLGQGEYYIAFWGAMTGNTDWGSALLKISVGEAGAPSGPGLVQADEVDPQWLVNAGQTYQQTGFKLSNTGGSPVSNITVELPSTIDTYIDVSLDKTSLGVNETTFFTVSFSGSQTGLRLLGDAEVKSGDTVLGTIPFNIRVSIIEGGQVTPPTTSAGGLSASPSTWTASGVVGDSFTKTVTITNNAGSSASNFSYTASGMLSSIASVDLPTSISAGGTGSATITASPFSSGVYVGPVRISSSAGSVDVMAGLTVYEDISIDIEDVTDDLESAESMLTAAQKADPTVSDMLNDIRSSLEDAEDDFSMGQYERAQSTLQEARGKISALDSVAAAAALAPTAPTAPSAGGGVDILPFALIIALVAVLVVAVWYYLTKIRKAKPKIEKELEEEY